jgi:hypothetical protein
LRDSREGISGLSLATVSRNCISGQEHIKLTRPAGARARYPAGDSIVYSLSTGAKAIFLQFFRFSAIRRDSLFGLPEAISLPFWPKRL